MPLTDDRLPDVIRAAVAFARRLAPPHSVPARIARNLRSEAHGEVGLRCLQALLQWFPKDPATLKALRAAVREGGVKVRLQAAIALGEEGRAALIALALENTGESSRARAIEALGAHLPREVAEQVYASAVANGETRAAAACLAGLGRIGGEEAVAALGRALGESGDELGAAAARALGETGLPGAEAPLLANLGRGGAVTLACAEALGRIGSVRAVPDLKECAAETPGDPQLGRAVRQAVAAIQSRLEGADPGQLSLAAAGAGELSVVGEDASGRLTVTGGEASGRLSVSREDAGGRLALPGEERREPHPRARPGQLEGNGR